MPWPDRSPRRTDLPADWDRVRARVLARAGHRCEAVYQGQRCGWTARDVDHIVARSLGGDDDETNLQALCAWHHARKSAAEGGRASAAVKPRQRRAPERHPGLL